MARMLGAEQLAPLPLSGCQLAFKGKQQLEL